MPDDLARLSADLHMAAQKAKNEVGPIVNRGALNIKRQWKRNYEASEQYKKAPFFTRSINYDYASGGGAAWAEIGPDKSRTQGALGNLIEFGSVNNEPQNDGGRALNVEAPKFEREIAKLGETL